MTRLSGRVCAVTGAGSGIGRALALELGSRGARLAISDRDADGLAETERLLQGRGTQVLTEVLDVTDRDQFHGFADRTIERYGVVNGIYNNAGVAHRRSILEATPEDYDFVLGVNLWGVIHGTQVFLPHLIASGDGHVVNVSSLNGFMAQPRMSQYCASKFAVRGFTECLHMEMLEGGHPVTVHSVHPGGIKTNIANAAMENARGRGIEVTEEEERRQRTYNEKLLRMDPAQAAKIICDGVEARRLRILVGNDARFVDALVRLTPSRYPRLALALEKRTTR